MPQESKLDFPELHIIHPQDNQAHTHTAILLHGRASSGPEFAEDLFSSSTSTGKTLSACLPTWRWVFPTSRNRWSTSFQEDMCAWFDVYSLNDITARQELQVEGLRESVGYVLGIVEGEVERLKGEGEDGRVFLGGMSQGMAMGLWTLFCAPGDAIRRWKLGGFLGMSGWLPFAGEVEERGRGQGRGKAALGFFSKKISASDSECDSDVLSTPVLLTHGTDDVWVSVDLGRQARRVLEETMGLSVEWEEFTGAENDGHWVKEPEGFDRILRFLERT
ncbi:alpha/beta-hydrolase [Aspergillus cavernicola]|uniref:Alpha/beta-hydrolase n=1 Tax=Aspergillus cavernicola TaxID=176166 RepID=A0ABR4HLP0_9EURO